MVVSKRSLMVLISLVIMIMPSYFADMIPGYRLIMNIMSVFIVFYLVKHFVKPSGFILCVILYYFITLVSAFANGNFDYHALISQTKIIITLMLIESYLSYKRNGAVDVIYYVIAFFVLIDIISVILYPAGIYQTITVWNEWSSSSASQWVLGNKNNHIAWYLIAELLAYLKYINNDNFNNKIILYTTMIGCIVSSILLQSSTSTTVVVLAALGIFIAMHNKHSKVKMINIYVLDIIYVVIVVLVVTGITQFLSPIVKGVFGKNLTFTNRTFAWAQCIAQIIQKPFLGWGLITAEEAQSALGSLAYVNAHNQWLQTLWQGGIILLCVIILAIFLISNKINKLHDQNLKIVIATAFFAYLIEMILEVQLTSGISWLILLLVYNVDLFDSELPK